MTRFWLGIKIVGAALTSHSNQAFYDKVAPFYDDFFTSHKVHADNIIEILNKTYGDSRNDVFLLDLGCGTGMLTKLAIEQGYNVIGIDISLDSLKFLKSQAENVQTIQADGYELPFADGCFDSVISLGVLRHFSDIDKVIREIHRVLSKDGVFVVGYFPPDLGGTFKVSTDKTIGKLFVAVYSKLTKALGYTDDVNDELEERTEEIAQSCFRNVKKVNSGLEKKLLFAIQPTAITDTPEH